eukprot:2797387-Prymnesium_polylepis.1
MGSYCSSLSIFVSSMMFMRLHGRSAKPVKSWTFRRLMEKLRSCWSVSTSSAASRGVHALAAAARAAHNERRASSAAVGISAAAAASAAAAVAARPPLAAAA